MTDYTAFQKVDLILFNNTIKILPTEIIFVLKILKKFFITTLIPFRTPKNAITVPCEKHSRNCQNCPLLRWDVLSYFRHQSIALSITICWNLAD